MNKVITLQHQRTLNDSLLEKEYFLECSLNGLNILSLKDPRVTLCFPQHLPMLTTTKLFQALSSCSLMFAQPRI